MPNVTVEGTGYGFTPLTTDGVRQPGQVQGKETILVLPKGKSVVIQLHLGSSLHVRITPAEGVVTCEPLTNPDEGAVRRFKLTGVAEGSATFKAQLDQGEDGNPWATTVDMILPVTIRVNESTSESRQAIGSNRAGSPPKLHPDFAAELRRLSWRQAVIRVAEDQMYSEKGISSKAGDGVYDDSGIMWCGSFVYWCFEVVATAKGAPNPFGGGLGQYNPLRSGIKALDMGLSNPGMFDVLNYEGGKMFGGVVGAIQPGNFTIKTATRANATNIERGDIVLPRRDRGIFEHVALVYDPPDASGTFSALNGNALGNYRPDGMKTPYCDIGISVHTDAFDQNKLQTDTVIKSDGKDITMFKAGYSYFRYVFLHFKSDPFGS